MAVGKRIRTPLRQRWRRFRYSILPFVFFAGFAIFTERLWERQVKPMHAVGEVEAVRIDVAAGTNGTLTELGPNRPNWTLFDHVERGGIVARLDDNEALAAADTIKAQTVELTKELEAVKERTRLDQFGLAHDHDREQTRKTLQHQTLINDRQALEAQIATDQIQAQREEVDLGFMRKAYERIQGTFSPQLLYRTQYQLEFYKKRIKENEARRDVIAKQEAEAYKRLEAYPPGIITPEMEKLLDPIRAQIATQDARLEELNIRIESLVVRSPRSGTIAAVYSWPGQNIQQGQPIVTIAATEGRYIVSYIPERKRFRPQPNMSVELRPRTAARQQLVSKVERIGPQYEPLPPHHLQDPNRKEWGIPVKISIPKQLDARPGELIDLTFLRDGRSG